MRPELLVISGWGPYPDKEIIDFKEIASNKVFLITGATGAGKTTIFDAISFALFDNVSGKNRGKGTLRSDFADDSTSTYVELVFLHNNKRYKIRRMPSYDRAKKRGTGIINVPETASLMCSDNLSIDITDENQFKVIAEGVNVVNEKILAMTGINYDQFKQIVMIAQGEFMELLMAESKKRTEIFRNIFGTRIYDQVRDSLVKRTNELKIDIEKDQNQMKGLLNSAEIDYENWEELISMESPDYNQIIELLKKNIDDSTDEYVKMSDMKKLIDEKRDRLIKKIQEIEENNKRIEELNALILRMNVLKEQESAIALKKETVEAAKRAAQCNVAFALLNTHNDNIKRCRTDLAALKQAKSLALDNYNKAAEEYNKLPVFEKVQTELQIEEQRYTDLLKKTTELEKAESIHKNAVVVTDYLKTKLYNYYKAAFERVTKEYECSEAVYKTSRDEYNEANDLHRRAAIGLIAKDLKDGEECPVCGSKTHPKIFAYNGDAPDETKIRKLEKVMNNNLESLNQIQVEYMSSKKKYEDNYYESSLSLDDASFDDSKINAFLLDIGCPKVNSKNITDAVLVETLKTVETENVKALQILSMLREDTKLDNFTSEDIINKIKDIKSKFNENKKAIESVTNIYNKAKDTSTVANSKEESKKIELDNLLGGLDKLKKDFEKVLSDNGFESEEEYKKCKLNQELINSMTEEISAYESEVEKNSTKQAVLKKQITLLESGVEKISIDEYNQELSEVRKEESSMADSLGDYNTRIQKNKMVWNYISKRYNLMNKKMDEYAQVKRLENVASGRDNSKRMTFEQYVLASYFDKILLASNKRLVSMSNGQFELFMPEKASRAMGQKGLEIEVLDNYTGKRRPVNTLSGGESFKAALSLALGMSDVISGTTGAISLDILFVDEGFGALDAESLDAAVDCLMELSYGDRLVGIISHVQELKERIDCQIVVEKTKKGSTIHVG